MNSVDKVKVGNGKYTIRCDHMNGGVDIFRYDELWVTDPHYSKMLISMMYEINMMRKLLSDIQYDFDPDKGELGPKCGLEMMNKIKEYEERYNVDLRFVEDIN